MYNVDTLSLCINFRRCISDEYNYTQKCKKVNRIDWKYVQVVNEKIIARLYLDKENGQVRKQEIRKNNLTIQAKEFLANLIGKKIKHKNIYWKGKYGSYFLHIMKRGIV